jgi:hypothetical protein
MSMMPGQMSGNRPPMMMGMPAGMNAPRMGMMNPIQIGAGVRPGLMSPVNMGAPGMIPRPPSFGPQSPR